jgi:hypothetical protein
MAKTLTIEPIQIGEFTIAVVQSGGYFFGRIRRSDGQTITRSGETHAAIGTKPCRNALEAFEEARCIIKRGDLQ